MTQAQLVELLQREHAVSPLYAQYLAKRVYTAKSPVAVAKEVIEREKAQPFVKWVGGKRQLLAQFRDRKLYPPSVFDAEKNTYYEPFVGGGAVFFDLFPQRAILSDLNKDLVITYNVIKNDVESLIKSLKKHRYEKEYFLKVRKQKHVRDIDIASRFIFLNRTCFNGMYRVNSRGEFNVPFGKYTNPRICDAENLRKVSVALKKVTIRREDYSRVLARAKKGDFIYFDPPYHPLNTTSSFTSYTSDGFSAADQIRLRDIFVTLHKRGCFVMLSNSNSEFIKKIYKEIDDKNIRIHEVSAGRNINSKSDKRGKVKEVLITNY